MADALAAIPPDDATPAPPALDNAAALIPGNASVPVATPGVKKHPTLNVPAWAQAMAGGEAPPPGVTDKQLAATPDASAAAPPTPSAPPATHNVEVELPDGSIVDLGPNPTPELRAQVKAKILAKWPELATPTPPAASVAAPDESPTFMGEMAKEGERQRAALGNIASDVNVATHLGQNGFAEGVKHGVRAAWEALGLVHPGVIPEAALTAAGHPIAGKVAGVATDVALSFATGGGAPAITSAEEAALAAKGAVGKAAGEAVATAKAGYAARDAAADAAGLTFVPNDPAVEALKKVADETVKKHGSKAAEWVGRIENLGSDASGGPVPITHEDIRNIEAGLTETAKRDPWIGHLRDAVSRTRDAMEAQAPDVAAQSQELASAYPEVAKLRRLKKLVVNPSNAPSTERTTAESLRALNDPDRLKAALATMDPATADAFQLFHRQAKIAQAITGGTGVARDLYRAAFVPVMAIEGGRLIYKAAQGDVNLGELGAAGAAIALHSPRVAMMTARALTTPATSKAGVMLARSLATELGIPEGGESGDAAAQ